MQDIFIEYQPFQSLHQLSKKFQITFIYSSPLKCDAISLLAVRKFEENP